MFSILPISVNFRQDTKSLVSRTGGSPSTSCTQPPSVVARGEDITNKFSQREIKNILKKLGTYQEPERKILSERYSVTYYNDTKSFVIHDTCRTNNTTSINESGVVYHRGSWHKDKVKDKNKAGLMDGTAVYQYMKSKMKGNI